jgi:hypothetical protein
MMLDIYRQHQAQRLTKIEALLGAQSALIGQLRHSHPYYGAPFTLMREFGAKALPVGIQVVRIARVLRPCARAALVKLMNRRERKCSPFG